MGTIRDSTKATIRMVRNVTKKAKAHEENFANAREARNYLERCIERQASRIVDIEDISDDDIKTLTLEDVTEK